MGRLTPITLDDGTTIYIEAIENTASGVLVPDKPIGTGDPKRGLFTDEPQKQITQNFQAIEHTIRAYTLYTLNAFKGVAMAEVSEVTLKFGINISSEAGVPYIANAKGGCNLEINVKCQFPKIPET
ncbi:hypothetical protein C7B65_15005 [Phormidesmis priestleyi ULC007]|uniref:Trypsin-co-occurring domain-containing protein n=1 Tax=Phormidesmis priestleyi ULC007 TaxID=1920490 RepID=A0A2T1DDL4_9CYAN|nr:CU044_2847 family protein [Phormidesmis priestleyi]PSB18600.1 hypothetical protein C7B65_15005 [Phormidesmis priestleyi ULC007]PZO49752.1 MAG: hypothetical protein DCF14_13080 [Phormidesmis priestleyi]